MTPNETSPDQAVEAVALLRCPNPWCGENQPDLIVWGSARKWRVQCDCGIYPGDSDTEAEAVALWNDRTAIPTPPPANEGLRQMTRLDEELGLYDDEKVPPADHTDLIARKARSIAMFRALIVELEALPEDLLELVRLSEPAQDMKRILKVADALQAHASPREWQDIATAPDEGRVLVIGGRHGQAEIVDADGRWWNTPANAGLKSLPTHWMPVPSFARTALELG